MSDKKQTRLRRARRGRAKIRSLGMSRLCVNRPPRHIYAQIIVSSEQGDTVVAAASTLDKAVKPEGSSGNIDAASLVGELIADRAKAAGVTKVAFDRSGFKYHGRVQALADAARAGGLEF